MAFAQRILQQALQQYGDPEEALVAAAQAVLETGHGRSVPGGNLFGIKGGGGPQLATWEVINGVPVNTTASFRSYPNEAASIADRSRFLLENPRYRTAGYFQAPTAEAKAEALQRAGYATDPAYSAKLKQIISQLRGQIGAIPESPASTPEQILPAEQEPLMPTGMPGGLLDEPTGLNLGIVAQGIAEYPGGSAAMALAHGLGEAERFAAEQRNAAQERLFRAEDRNYRRQQEAREQAVRTREQQARDAVANQLANAGKHLWAEQVRSGLVDVEQFLPKTVTTTVMDDLGREIPVRQTINPITDEISTQPMTPGLASPVSPERMPGVVPSVMPTPQAPAQAIPTEESVAVGPPPQQPGESRIDYLRRLRDTYLQGDLQLAVQGGQQRIEEAVEEETKRRRELQQIGREERLAIEKEERDRAYALEQRFKEDILVPRQYMTGWDNVKRIDPEAATPTQDGELVRAWIKSMTPREAVMSDDMTQAVYFGRPGAAAALEEAVRGMELTPDRRRGMLATIRRKALQGWDDYQRVYLRYRDELAPKGLERIVVPEMMEEPDWAGGTIEREVYNANARELGLDEKSMQTRLIPEPQIDWRRFGERAGDLFLNPDNVESGGF